MVAALLAPLQLAVVIVRLGSARGYNPWQQSISELALGPDGWILRVSVLACGLGGLGLAWAVSSRLAGGKAVRASLLLGLVSLCLMTLSVFPSYRDQPRVPALAHITAFGLAAVALLACCWWLPAPGRSLLPAWFERYSRISAGLGVTAFLGLVVHAGTIAFHLTTPLTEVAGGVERAGVGIMGLWLEVLAGCILVALSQRGRPLQCHADSGEQ
jgi:hypothetical protein